MRKTRVRHPGGLRKAGREKGFTLIELMIAAAVLAVGMAGSLGLLFTAIQTNGGNKQDTQAVMLAQMVAEQIAARSSSTNVTISLDPDCNPAGATTWTINTTGSASPGTGATLISSTGNIDFSQAYANIASGYAMKYVACGDNSTSTTDGTQLVYDVRWNITTLSSSLGVTKLVTVAARPVSGNSSLALFSFPATLRTLVGN